MAGMFDLSGKVALVTGGNGGIGLGMARGLARHGATLAIAGRNRDKSQAAIAELQALGATAEAFVADIADANAVEGLMVAVAKRFGGLDILINNAGINIRKAPHELGLDEWRQVIDTNLTSAFVASKAAYPLMKERRGGKIINIGSMFSIFGAGFVPAYSASKGGLVQLTKSCASAWAPDRIQVNAILPGWIDTDLTVGARAQVAGLNEKVLARTPAGRWGEPNDLAGLAVFFASAASDFVTGTAVPVDGGFSIQG